MSVACPIGGPASLGTVPGFAEHVAGPFLVNAQNSDGGWGFHPDSDSAVEPTCWAVAALSGKHGPHLDADRAAWREEPVRRGLKWLCDAQFGDGSWPALPGQSVGCWVTSAACLALLACRYAPGAVARGRQWLCNSWPAEGTAWWRLSSKLLRRNSVIRQDSSLRGWSWTQGTASWVEPTSAALLALRSLSAEGPGRGAARRQNLGERMLYDRMCPGGGWNSGNPLVYGVAGEPRIGPTAWALLALRQYAGRHENQISLQWLRDSYAKIRGPVSLSLAYLCLAAYGKAVPGVEPALDEMFLGNQFLGNVAAVAWSLIAAQGGAPWLYPVPGNGSRQ